MKYTEEEILAHACARVRSADRQKRKGLILGFMGISLILLFILLINQINDVSHKIGANLLLDADFIRGIGVGILIVMYVGIAIMAILPMLPGFGGPEVEVCRLLVRLREEKAGGRVVPNSSAEASSTTLGF